MTAAINLLTWRENRVKLKLRQDFFMAIFLCGLLALIVECALAMSHFYCQYLIHQQQYFQNKILAQSENFKQANLAQSQLKQIKKQLAVQKNNQATWKNLSHELTTLIKEKPNSINLIATTWQKQSWLISGFANKMDDVTRYQTNLLGKNFKAEINQWSPKNSNHDNENFQLSAEK